MGMARSGLACEVGRVEQWESLYRVWWRRPLGTSDDDEFCVRDDEERRTGVRSEEQEQLWTVG